ncbi:MAG: nucleotidyltransferase family protein [Spirochaetota bacterium]
MERTHIDCIMPAAGVSSRMGDWKLMLPYRGRPIIDHALEHALEIAQQIIVVTGFRGDELRSHLSEAFPTYWEQGRITAVTNRNYTEGMFSSIQTGLKHSSRDVAFIHHGDLPCLPTSLFAEIMKEFEQAPPPRPDAIRPVYRGIPGHPVLLSAAARELILTLPPGASMQQAFESLRVLEIEAETPGAILDVDTPEAYQQLITKW